MGSLDDKIARKQKHLEKLEERLGFLMSQRAVLENELAGLLIARGRLPPSGPCQPCRGTGRREAFSSIHGRSEWACHDCSGTGKVRS